MIVHIAHKAPMPAIQTDWLKARKKELKVSDAAIGEAIGVDRSVVNKVIAGKVEFHHRYVDGFAETLKMSREDVLFRFGVLGEGAANPNIPADAIPVKGIPHLGEVPGGPWQEAVRTSHHFIPAPAPGLPPSAYALTVRGGSMDRLVKDGAMIIIDEEDHDLYDKGLYVVRNPDGEFTFKQYRDNPARLVPCSSDPSHKVIPITNRDYAVVGAVIKIIYDPYQAAVALD